MLVGDMFKWCRVSGPHVLTIPVLSFCLPSCTDIQFRSPSPLGDVVLVGAGDPPSGDMLGVDPLTAPWLRMHERHNPKVGVVVLTVLGTCQRYR